MRLTPYPINIFIGFTTIILMVIYMFVYGAGNFFMEFPRTSLLWIGVVVFISPIIYYVLLHRLKKKMYFEYKLPEDEFDQTNDKNVSDLLIAYCTRCKKEGFYHFADDTKSHLWICWNCGRESSVVWCEKCGMGGHYVRGISSRPKTWKCPKCKHKYDLPDDFYDNPLQPAKWEEISLSDKNKYFNMQKNFQIHLLREGIVGFSSLALSAIWMSGMMGIVSKSISHPLALFALLILGWFGLWIGGFVCYQYGYIFYKKWKDSL